MKCQGSDGGMCGMWSEKRSRGQWRPGRNRKRRLASASGRQLRGIMDVVNVNPAIFIEDDSSRPGAFLSCPNKHRRRCSHRSRINGTLEAME